jgi:BirA family biotin operon repressor/biotin-[acetyl-CoA-carboxylase] ligase
MASTGEDALSANAIREQLGPGSLSMLGEVTVLDEVDSTNAFLARLSAPRRHAHVVLADSQTQGRGRRQRSWHSPPGGNLYMSLGWRFGATVTPLSTLPLAVAVCLAQALERTGLTGHGIKWPNDILVGGRKLAGILVESQSPGTGSVQAVIGIGLNVRMPALPEGVTIDRPWTELSTHLPPARRGISRNLLAALSLDELLPGLERFAAEGFEPFREGWRRFDLLEGRRVRLEGNGGSKFGTVLGIEDNGGLSVDIEGYGPQVLHAAEVSIYDE